MTDSALHDLAQLTDALYQAELAKLHEINAQEAALRRDLVELDAHRRQGMSLPDGQLGDVRRIGADILWQGWVGRTKEDLLRQLALVLVQKNRMMQTLRKAFGKHSAATDLLAASQQAHLNDRLHRRDTLEQGLMMLKSHQGQPGERP